MKRYHPEHLHISGSVPVNLKYFETIHVTDLKHTVIKRGLKESYHPFNKINQVEFSTLGRNFRLILSPKRTVLHSKFKAYVVNSEGKEKAVHLDHDNFFGGRVFGEKESDANVHIENGVMTGVIHLPDETYHIEPSWRHLPDLGNKSMITYRSSDVKLGRDRSDRFGLKTCGYIKEGEELEKEEEGEESKRNRDDAYYNLPIWQGQREKRQLDQYEYTPTKTRCPLLLVADYRFFQEMGGSNTKTTINYLVSI